MLGFFTVFIGAFLFASPRCDDKKKVQLDEIVHAFKEGDIHADANILEREGGLPHFDKESHEKFILNSDRVIKNYPFFEKDFKTMLLELGEERRKGAYSSMFGKIRYDVLWTPTGCKFYEKIRFAARLRYENSFYCVIYGDEGCKESAMHVIRDDRLGILANDMYWSFDRECDDSSPDGMLIFSKEFQLGGVSKKIVHFMTMLHDEKMSSRTMTIIVQPVFDAELKRYIANKWEIVKNIGDKKEAIKHFTEFHYLFAHYAPYYRGSAAVGEWICAGFMQRFFPEVESEVVFKKCQGADIDALSYDFEDFSREYQKRWYE